MTEPGESPKSVRFAIDDCHLEGSQLVVRGWFIATPPPERLDIAFGSTLTCPCTTFGQPSQDVDAVFGPGATHVRFHERFAVPPGLTTDMLAAAEFIVDGVSGSPERHRLFPNAFRSTPASPSRDRPLEELRVGIGITTYNRCAILADTLDGVAAMSRMPHTLVVADDGSTDGTREMLAARGVPTIGNRNCGIAWNKNRALFHLASVARCDVVILLEDDTYPCKVGWESEWVIAAVLYGHCNYQPPWFGPARSGFSKWFDPAVSRDAVSGQCSSFTADALGWVGYMDSRFGRYGYEHAEHSMRMLRTGFGGYFPVDAHCYDFLLIEGGLAVASSVSSHSAESVEANALVLAQIKDEPVFRPAWRTDTELQRFRDELRLPPGDPAALAPAEPAPATATGAQVG